MRSVLIIVDVQHDFLPGGSLAVPNGDEVIKPLLRLAEKADLVIATRDWHPRDHMSFGDNPDFTTTFPVHCVAGTWGAQIERSIDSVAHVVLSKGMDKDVEQFSGFSNPVLARILHEQFHYKHETIIGGLATDFCVMETVRDAVNHGIENIVVYRDSVRGLHWEAEALADMKRLGVDIR